MPSLPSEQPQVRVAGLLSRELPGGELMVYDQERHQAHTLNRSAALVWRHCDGQTSVAALAARLEQELGLPADEALVELALNQLQKAHLLHGLLGRPATGLSRRAAIRKLGLAGGLTAALVPLVASIASPSPTVNGSCLPVNAPCTSSTQCCSGV